jgi:uncharacterized Zn-finger protein
LSEHQETVHEGRTYDCSDCDKNFNSKGALKHHQETYHEENHYNCSNCEKSFSSKYYLKQHQETVHEGKGYDCSNCDKSFSSQQYLKRHQGKTHKCDYCGKMFSCKNGLKRHQKSLHKELSSVSIVIESEPSKGDILIKEIEALRELIEITAFTRNVGKLIFRPSTWFPNENSTDKIEKRLEKSLKNLAMCQLDMMDFCQKLLTDRLEDYTGVVFKIEKECDADNGIAETSPERMADAEKRFTVKREAVHNTDRIENEDISIPKRIKSENMAPSSSSWVNVKREVR